MQSLINLVVLVSIIYAIVAMDKMKKAPNAAKEKLTKKEWYEVIITVALSPILANAIYYYGLKDKAPLKANQANKLSWIIFGIEAIVFIAFIVIVALNIH